MSYEIVDTLYRSRKTLLDHLEQEGYDIAPFSKFSPKEIAEMVKAGPIAGAPPALQMELNRKVPDDEHKHRKCLVVYTIGKIKQKLNAFTQKIISSGGGAGPAAAGASAPTASNPSGTSPPPGTFDPDSTEVIIVTMEPIGANFNSMAFLAHSVHKTKVRFFQAAAIINNPLKHILVPKHERVPAKDEEALLKSIFAKKSQLPLIRFHEDPIARLIGLMPGEIVKITRPSPTAGECILYRVCVP
jgi:DNA-directed RNA polymerase subunit H (RpoH/RPB5)